MAEESSSNRGEQVGDAPNRLVVGIASTLGVVAAFTTFVLVSRLGLASSGLAPADLLALRLAAASAIALPLLVLRRPRWPGPLMVATVAMTGGLGFSFLAYTGFELAPASHGSALVHGMLPLMTAAFGILLHGRRIRLVQLAALALISAGAFGLALGDPSGIYLQGDLALLAASACWALYGIVLHRAGLPSLDVVSIVVVTSAGLFLPAYLIAGAPANLASVGAGVLLGQALIQGAFIGFGSVWLYSIATQTLGATTVAAAAALVPAVVAVLAVPFLGEELYWSTAACIMLIVGGSLALLRFNQAR